jgi:ribosomal protein L14
MIQKSSLLGVTDKNGVWSVYVFHLYRGFNRRVSHFGDYIKVSVRDTKPNNWLLKKTKKKAIVVRTSKEISIIDGTTVSYTTNSSVILKKRLTPEGTEIIGPILRTFKKKKFLTSFSGVI